MRTNDLFIRIFLVLGGLTIAAASYSVFYIGSRPHMWDKLWVIMINNFNFWFLLITGLAYAIWRKWKNSDEVTWLEFPIQLLVGCILTFGIFGAVALKSTGLHDTETWNGKAIRATHMEAWTQEVEVESCDDDGNCTTSTFYVNHPEHWYIDTSNAEVVSISRRTYNNYIQLWGKDHHVELYRSDEAIFSDGDKYVIDWNGSRETIIPTAVQHDYINFLKASKSIKLRSGLTKNYTHLLKPYPTIGSSNYGNIFLNRVVKADVDVPNEWINAVNQQLNMALVNLGSYKEVNLLVYIVNSSDRGFIHALEEHWTYGKKNDVTLIIGMTEFPNVKWANAMVFSGNEGLVADLSSSVEQMSDLTDPKNFSTNFLRHVSEKFKRVPMATMDHLLHDIEIPFWALLVMILLLGASIGFVSFVVENNTIRTFKFKRYRRY